MICVSIDKNLVILLNSNHKHQINNKKYSEIIFTLETPECFIILKIEM